ncbi:hypothetical protein SK128_013571 [Halocaridina rubra]|uniref:Uncharacterized protein n=1 Tax=Halocaridina rubra TaxID=373956 RepID=A0AAN8WVV1_HALRR
MKLIFFTCALAIAIAAPQRLTEEEARAIPVLRDARSDEGDGNFAYEFETGNGIAVVAAGTPGEEGQSNIEGSYRFPLSDGRFLEVSYIADERGYRPSSRYVEA